jgi:hypothetical protein
MKRSRKGEYAIYCECHHKVLVVTAHSGYDIVSANKLAQMLMLLSILDRSRDNKEKISMTSLATIARWAAKTSPTLGS